MTHDLRLASQSDEILFLSSGRIVERETHDRLMMGNRGYAEMDRLQADSRNRISVEAEGVVSIWTCLIFNRRRGLPIRVRRELPSFWDHAFAAHVGPPSEINGFQ